MTLLIIIKEIIMKLIKLQKKRKKKDNDGDILHINPNQNVNSFSNEFLRRDSQIPFNQNLEIFSNLKNKDLL